MVGWYISSEKISFCIFSPRQSCSPFTLVNFSFVNLVIICRCSSSTTNPVCERHVNLLVCSLPLHRHSYMGFILDFASSIHNKQTVFENPHPLQFSHPPGDLTLLALLVLLFSFFSPPPPDTPFSHVDLSILYGRSCL